MTATPATSVPLPDPSSATVVVQPPGTGPGNWVGGPSAAVDGPTTWLAWRVRRPEGDGRGVGIALGRSTDGERFEQVALVDKERFGAESLERPALVRTPAGEWHLYMSCATPGSKHWRVDLLRASTPEALADAEPVTVLPGGDKVGVKDPVVRVIDGTWHMWLCCHPLDEPDATDRMWTDHLTSEDGVRWHRSGPALLPPADGWNRRGARATAVHRVGGRWVCWYDGRATAQENFEERTGLAFAEEPGPFALAAGGPAAESPNVLGGLRYLDVVEQADGSLRFYYELTNEDGSHSLCTNVV